MNDRTETGLSVGTRELLTVIRDAPDVPHAAPTTDDARCVDCGTVEYEYRPSDNDRARLYCERDHEFPTAEPMASTAPRAAAGRRGRITFNPNTLTGGQRDGDNCVACGTDLATGGPSVPVGAVDGCQVFACASHADQDDTAEEVI